MATQVQDLTPIKYGNFRRVGHAGVAGFGAAATIVGFVGLVFTLIGLAFGGPKVGVVIFALVVVGLRPTRRARRDGRTAYERRWAKIRNRQARKSGKAVLLQGPAGFVPDGKCRLPGLLAPSQLFTARDPFGAEFGVIVVPSAGHYTVTIECSATGQDLLGLAEDNRQVAQWGAFLAMVGENPDVVGAQAVIETAPDTGMRLRDAILTQRKEDAPPFAVAVGDAQMELYPVGEASIRTWVTVTFASTRTAEDGKKGRRSREEMAERLGNYVPMLLSQVRVSGGGLGARLMTAADLTDTVRVAFDPSVALDVERARRDDGGTGLTWEEAGPVRLRPYDDLLQHDRAYSQSWQMTEPSTGSISDRQLQRLLSPSKDIERKRVALLYRPYDAMSAVNVVEQDVNSTTFSASQKKRPTARQVREMTAANLTAEAEAEGAGITRFGIVITVTSTTTEKAARAAAAVTQLATPARLRLRPTLGNQEVAFTSSLPCGLVLPYHAALPVEMREYF